MNIHEGIWKRLKRVTIFEGYVANICCLWVNWIYELPALPLTPFMLSLRETSTDFGLSGLVS